MAPRPRAPRVQRVPKPSVESQKKSTRERDRLLERLHGNHVKMPVCSTCTHSGLEICEASATDSRRCIECVRLGKSTCDVLGTTPEQVAQVSAAFKRLDGEVEILAAELSASLEKTMRLKHQKNMWAITQGETIRRDSNGAEAERAAAWNVGVDPTILAGGPPSTPGGSVVSDPDAAVDEYRRTTRSGSYYGGY